MNPSKKMRRKKNFALQKRLSKITIA